MTPINTQSTIATEEDRRTHAAEPPTRDADATPGAARRPSGPTLGWIAVAVVLVAAMGLVVAVVLGGSDESATDDLGSDQHLVNIAEEGVERPLAATGNPRTAADKANALARNGRPPTKDVGSDQHLRNLVAEGDGS